MTSSSGDPVETPQAKLARKLNLLLDLYESQGSGPLSYRKVSEHLAARGTPLSRSRWAYMRSGDSSMATERELLKNLAEFFGVDPQYLLEENAEIPDLVEAQLNLLRSMREARVRNFAARQLQGISPETLARLREVIDERTRRGDEDGS